MISTYFVGLVEYWGFFRIKLNVSGSCPVCHRFFAKNMSFRIRGNVEYGKVLNLVMKCPICKKRFRNRFRMNEPITAENLNWKAGKMELILDG